MKKVLTVLLVATVAASAFANDFTDALQDLAMQTACVGQYSATQAGGGWYDDPHDYYQPWMLAERFAKMSGNMTRTATFYGICFDYAQSAFEDIQKYKSWYNEQGMYESQFWVAGVHDNPNQIELMSIGTKSDYTRLQNGVPIKTYPTSLRACKTHDGATNHAWLWVERADGVWFWIDPTWTDTLGFVVYGYVKNGEEIQCRPDAEFCINYPNYLKSLPLPPAMGARMAPSKTVNSTNRNETINDAAPQWIAKFEDYFISGDYDFDDNYIVFLASADVPFLAISDKSFGVDKMGFALEMPIIMEAAGIVGVEYLRNIDDTHRIRGILFEYDFAHRLTNHISWFLGGGAGARWDTLQWQNHYEPSKEEAGLVGTGWFAFKANVGLLVNVSRVFVKVDVSYNNVLGFSFGAGVGVGL